ncbi:MAG: hypothetical protein JO362_21065 [Streptomycetaceae bacterium]|nr:hypothetical protein [Streptomycetaceae bacterium]
MTPTPNPDPGDGDGSVFPRYLAGIAPATPVSAPLAVQRTISRCSLAPGRRSIPR